MSATMLILRPDVLRLKRGDLIVAVDGQVLAKPHEVAHRPVVRTDPIRLVNQLGSGTEWNLYLDLIGSGLTIERPVVDRVIIRTIKGVKFRNRGHGHWETLDGRFEVLLMEDFETECLAAHPVRFPRDGYTKEQLGGLDYEIRWAYLDGKGGYLCPGYQPHTYSRWQVWDNSTGDYAFDSGPGAYVTFKDAAEDLADEIAGEAATAIVEQEEADAGSDSPAE